MDRIVIDKPDRMMTEDDRTARVGRVEPGMDRLNDRNRLPLPPGLDHPHADPADGNIFIHSQSAGRITRVFRMKGDWIEGCIPVSDEGIEDPFAAARIGTEVEIRP